MLDIRAFMSNSKSPFKNEADNMICTSVLYLRLINDLCLPFIQTSKPTRFPKTQQVFEFESKSYINELKIVAEVLDRVGSTNSLGEVS